MYRNQYYKKLLLTLSDFLSLFNHTESIISLPNWVGRLFLLMKYNKLKHNNPKNKMINVVVPHINQPKASPVDCSILYKPSTKKIAVGKVPIPPGVKIIAKVARV